VVLGDSKPQNWIITRERSMCLTDLEQAGEDGDPSWDVAMMVFYGAKFAFDEQRILSMMRGLVDGYVEEGDAEVVREAGSVKYVGVFAPLVAPQVLRALVDLCKSA
jgi:aminoglycoside phosphotransferase (APT) family kinase protein